jgi:ankyrin repeat protein
MRGFFKTTPAFRCAPYGLLYIYTTRLNMQSSNTLQPATPNFYLTAFEAAREGLTAFREAFNRPEADANAHGSHPNINGTLIHELIKTIPDLQLPPLLQVLVDNNVDLEANSITGTPIFVAACYQKKETIKFLILNNAKTHGDSNSVLVQAIPLSKPKDPDSTMDIIKMLIEDFSIPIDSIDKHGRTALQRAANESYLFIIEYLLAKGAKMLAFPLATAYDNMNSICEYLQKLEYYKNNIDSCFKVLFDAAYAYFFNLVYNTNMPEDSFKKNYFSKFITEACQQYPYESGAAKKEILIKYLQENLGDKVIRDVALAKQELEQRNTIFVGLATPKKVENRSPLYLFGQHGLFDRNLIKTIFSFAHEIPAIGPRLNQTR